MKRILLSGAGLVDALKLSIFLSSVEEDDEYLFDFTSVVDPEPFWMLFVSSQIARLRTKFPKSKISCMGHQRMKYARDMGFFSAFNMDYPPVGNLKLDDVRCLPIRIIDCQDLRDRALDEGVYVGEVIEGHSQELATILCGEDSGSLFDTLTYSMREIIRNVVEHSESRQLGLCAQFWPDKEKVEVALVDRGVGLKSTLSNNHHLDVSDDKAALNYALMPAVSGKNFKGSRYKAKGPWANSGFGLYMTNRICRNGGTFFIATGSQGMLLGPLTKGQGKQYFNCAFQGTAIRMIIRTKDLPEISSALNRYKKEGFETQKEYAEIVKIDPSAASLMLSQDFDKDSLARLKKILFVS